MSTCVKPSVFSFDRENNRNSWRKPRNAQQSPSNLQPIRLNMKDAALQMVSVKREKHSKYFSLSVTSRQNYSMCEITETLPGLEKRETLERSRKIQDFYIRKKTSNKLKRFEKNKSFVEIQDFLENDEKIQNKQVSTPGVAKVRTIYYSDRHSSNFIPKTLKTFMKVAEPTFFNTRPEEHFSSSRGSEGQEEKTRKTQRKGKILPSIKRRKSKHNNCISIQTDEHAI